MNEIEIDIYLDDLCEEKREEIIEALGGDIENYDILPITTLYFYPEDYV